MADEQTVEHLAKQAAHIRERLQAARQLEKQRTHLLPSLEKEQSRLGAMIAPLVERQAAVGLAIADIREGRGTTFSLRPRKVKLNAR